MPEAPQHICADCKDPPKQPNYDDNYEGYEYRDGCCFEQATVGLMDRLNLPIKMAWQRDGFTGPGGKPEPSISFWRFQPRHGKPVIMVLRGEQATQELYERMLGKVQAFYVSPKAGRTSIWKSGGLLATTTLRNGTRVVGTGKVSSLAWDLGHDDWEDKFHQQEAWMAEYAKVTVQSIRESKKHPDQLSPALERLFKRRQEIATKLRDAGYEWQADKDPSSKVPGRWVRPQPP